MVENTENKVVYIVGTSRKFAFPVPFFAASDVKVYLNSAGQSVLLSANSDYSVENRSDYSNGSEITLLLDPLPVGAKLAIVRELPLQQHLNLPDHGKLPSSELENSLDKLIMICQMLQEKISRCINLDVTSSENSQQVFEAIMAFKNDCPQLLEQMSSYVNECRQIRQHVMTASVENAVGFVKISDVEIELPDGV